MLSGDATVGTREPLLIHLGNNSPNCVTVILKQAGCLIDFVAILINIMSLSTDV